MPASGENFEDCEKVSPSCPVEATTYGYAPSLGGNTIYAVIFAACALVQLFFVFRHWRLWKGYTILVCIGCIGECCGYVGRIFLHNNPWNGGAMSIQFVLLMVSPSFLAAALYMSLRTLVNYFGPEHTRLPERFWTWPFVTADTVGFLAQCGGGILASIGERNPSLGTAGIIIMVTGVTFQAVVMGVAGCLATDFAIRFRRRQATGAFKSLPRNLQVFLLSMSAAFLLILTRCIYRIPELAGGVGGPLMRQEAEFMIFDGLMTVLSVIVLTVVHPGRFGTDLRDSTVGKSGLMERSNRGSQSSDIENGYELCRDTRYSHGMYHQLDT